MSFIADTSTLSNFAGIGRVDVLRQVYGTVYLPVEVVEEIRTGLDEGYSFYDEVLRVLDLVAGTGWLRVARLADQGAFSSARARNFPRAIMVLSNGAAEAFGGRRRPGQENAMVRRAQVPTEDIGPFPSEEFRCTEMAWLQTHQKELAERYPGEWIAVQGTQLITHAESLQTLLRLAREKGYPRPFVTAVPASPILNLHV